MSFTSGIAGDPEPSEQNNILPAGSEESSETSDTAESQSNPSETSDTTMVAESAANIATKPYTYTLVSAASTFTSKKYLSERLLPSGTILLHVNYNSLVQRLGPDFTAAKALAETAAELSAFAGADLLIRAAMSAATAAVNGAKAVAVQTALETVAQDGAFATEASNSSSTNLIEIFWGPQAHTTGTLVTYSAFGDARGWLSTLIQPATAEVHADYNIVVQLQGTDFNEIRDLATRASKAAAEAGADFIAQAAIEAANAAAAAATIAAAQVAAEGA